MKAKEFKKIMDEMYKSYENVTDAAKDTYELIIRIAEAEANRGADASDVEVALLDNNLFLDGEDQRQYCENLLGKNLKDFDVEGAKILWMIKECVSLRDLEEI